MVTTEALIGANERFDKPQGIVNKHADLKSDIESILNELKALKRHNQTPDIDVLISDLTQALVWSKE